MAKYKREFIERRTGKDRRKFLSMKGLAYRGKERRVAPDRRLGVERRKGWVRISKWSSVPLDKLKISKYIKRKVSLTNNSF